MYTVSGTYGASRTPCEVFVYSVGPVNWYAVEGSLNVNATYEDISDGVDVETLSDVDTGTAASPIDSLDDLENFINE